MRRYHTTLVLWKRNMENFIGSDRQSNQAEYISVRLVRQSTDKTPTEQRWWIYVVRGFSQCTQIFTLHFNLACHCVTEAFKN